MSYNGAFTLDELRQRVKFIRMTSSGFSESEPHSISRI
jgi:IMP dehydrogenase/GMP reductase